MDPVAGRASLSSPVGLTPRDPSQEDAGDVIRRAPRLGACDQRVHGRRELAPPGEHGGELPLGHVSAV